MDPAYITFDMGGHEYTATVYAIEDLKRWMAANHIESRTTTWTPSGTTTQAT